MSTETIEDKRDDLVKFALSLCDNPDLAEDLVQQAYLEFYESETEIEFPYTWLSHKVRRLNSDHFRRSDTKVEQLENPNLVLDSEEDKELSMALRELISKLNPGQQHLVGLMLEGYTNDEIADILSTAPWTVRREVKTAIQDMRRMNENSDRTHRPTATDVKNSGPFVASVR